MVMPSVACQKDDVHAIESPNPEGVGWWAERGLQLNLTDILEGIDGIKTAATDHAHLG